MNLNFLGKMVMGLYYGEPKTKPSNVSNGRWRAAKLMAKNELEVNLRDLNSDND